MNLETKKVAECLLRKINFKIVNFIKTIQDFKQELIDKNILKLSGVKKFANIVDKWK